MYAYFTSQTTQKNIIKVAKSSNSKGVKLQTAVCATIINFPWVFLVFYNTFK